MTELSFVREDGPGAPPLYQQLYRAISSQIAAGHILPGERMPGKRSLASALALSVNTVDAAYQQLAAEGWLESRPRSGFYAMEYDRPLREAFSAPRRSVQPEPLPEYRFDLSTGAVDTGLFPFHSWGRIQRELIYDQPDLLAHGHPQGDENLRIAIADYLITYRGVDCTPDQLVVGAGVEYLLGLLGRLLGGGSAALEDPGYSRTRIILQNSNLRCVPVPVDDLGLDPTELDKSGCSIVYVTPSHQFPTGAVMPVGRRADLLRWAEKEPGRIIIEDDYDSEFRFRIRPLPSLQGMAGQNGRVIYLATFSRSLAPSIRIAYMVLPRWLMEKFKATFGSYSSTVSRFEQQTLRVFLQEGHYLRHLARSRSQYLTRMHTLTSCLDQKFGPGRLRYSGQHTGVHLLMQLTDGPGETALVAAARKSGVRVSGLSEYSMGTSRIPDNTLVVGYGGLPTQQIEPLAEVLSQAWLSLAPVQTQTQAPTPAAAWEKQDAPKVLKNAP